MKSNSKNRQTFDTLLPWAQFVSRPITLTDSSEQKHIFRTFLYCENWGICGSDGSIIIKPNYATVKVLVHLQLLIAGKESVGWDVYSLSGELLCFLSAMTLDQAIMLLGEHNKA